jgi:hypothetical protein
VALGVSDDSLVVDYFRRGGDFVGLLALDAEDRHWAHAGRRYASVVREGISISFYVYACAFYDFVDFGEGFVIVSGGFVLQTAFLGCLPTALAFPCFRIGLFALPLCGAAPTFLCGGKEK